MTVSSKKVSPKSLHDSQFFKEVINGLTTEPKFLSSKYLYDAAGDELFQKIMQCPEYYLTRCEMEILSEQAEDITTTLQKFDLPFALVELGAGDASKTIHLLREFMAKGMMDTYYPIDISSHIIASLESHLPSELPGIRVKGQAGEYLTMLKRVNRLSDKPKIVLFLGASIGNYPPEKALDFCHELHDNLQPGDLLLIGFDLKKHPQIILDAYNDKDGYTRAFNMNLLQRINRDLGGDFDLSAFEHYPTYDPISGSCKSFLISLKEHEVQIASNTISFEANEPIFMEISQKYSSEETNRLAEKSGFEVLSQFSDKKGWFMDCLWRRKA